MLVSTFELLVKPIAPAGAGPAGLARTVVQGYFLSIANTSNVAAPLQLTFTATTPNLSVANTVAIRDVTGGNVIGDLVPTADPKRLTYNITIPAHDTALVILQPDVRLPAVLAGMLEVRGYVEINALSSPVPNTYELLVTPEHRGTFFSGSAAAPAADIDQLVYSLPTASGKAQYSLTSPRLMIDPKVIKDVVDAGTPKVIEVPTPKVIDTPPIDLQNVQAMLEMMTQRINGLEAAISQGQAFIQPSERPVVGTPSSNGN
ncbi:hypothetical protein [Leptolyngbya ohadii]|uniref:hypothetical protein n=1 Tax=Leptolyngbya ohadii TaxID=1962290 RepID=UPI000B59BEE6|nr:hypothetical protein [Leptolyngbya ohadii]